MPASGPGRRALPRNVTVCYQSGGHPASPGRSVFLPISPSPLERWFTTHPGPHAHSLAGTAAAAPAWDELAPLLAPGWERGIGLGYADPEGDGELRDRVATMYGLPDRAHVLLTQGAVEANWLALAALIEPGLRVVVQMPIYPQLPLVAAHLGANVVAWPYPWDLEALWPLLDGAGLLVLNTPHNPTGQVLNVALIRARAGCMVLVDEVYRGVGEAPIPPSALSWGPDQVLVSGSMSKMFGLPGLRLGWLVGDPIAVAAAIPWREHTTLALAGAATALGLAVWPKRYALLEANHAILTRNRARVLAWAGGRGQAPATAGVMLLEAADDVGIAERWYQEERGMVIPGTVCGFPGHLRLGFGHREPAALEAALASLSRFL
ncbi:MAG: Aspartate/tyrosine/aromatic aminotransferase [Cyanobacteria bacterium RYN_339]|nr:Aspartate/tyrosine/aromatic aminotransferase [Cyanobacteria bacterium RYN_339]